MIGQQLMKVEEIAARWRVSKMTVYRMIHDGRLPSAQIGKSFRVPVEEVERFESQTGRSPAEK